MIQVVLMSFASYNQTEFETLSNLLLTQDNFKSFAKLHSSVENFNCKVQQVIWIQRMTKLNFILQLIDF
jgi:hypothetical protein